MPLYFEPAAAHRRRPNRPGSGAGERGVHPRTNRPCSVGADPGSGTHCAKPGQCSARRWAMDHAVEELRLDALLGAGGNQSRQCTNTAARLQLFSGSQQGAGSGSDRRGQHDVCGHRLSELRVCIGSGQARRADEVEVLAQPGAGQSRARMLRCRESRRHGQWRKIHFQYSRWADDCGGRQDGPRALANATLETSTSGRRSPWLLWWRTDGCMWATPAGRWACAAGSPRSTKTTASCCGVGWSTGPDKDVLIGAEFKPRYPIGSGHGSRPEILASRGMEDRRRQHVGMGELRS